MEARCRRNKYILNIYSGLCIWGIVKKKKKKKKKKRGIVMQMVRQHHQKTYEKKVIGR